MKRALLAASLLFGAAAVSSAIRLPEGPGANLVYAKCQTCHDLQYVVDAKGLLPNQWDAVIANMKDYGLEATPEEEKQLVRYLSTYLGTHPPPAAPAGESSSQRATAKADGRALYSEICAGCHGPDGKGKAGYYPPLAGNPDLAKDPMFPVLVVLHGLSGPIEVKGERFNGVMPAFGNLSNAEVAAVVNYVRETWAPNGARGEVSATAVGAQRARDMTAEDVHTYRSRLN